MVKIVIVLIQNNGRHDMASVTEIGRHGVVEVTDYFIPWCLYTFRKSLGVNKDSKG
jgi:hypothetical protein